MFSVINIMEILKQTKNQLINLNQRFFLILENFVPHYVSYLQNPKNVIPAQEIEHVKSVINEINSQSFVLKNKMDVEIDVSQKLSDKLTKEIEILQKENVTLKNETRALKRSSLTAEGLFDDEIDWYRKQIQIIIVMIIGVIICGNFYRSFKLDLKQNIMAILVVIVLGVIIEKILMTIYDKIKD
jgi:hypothetical protein